jgi:hypothetical protein
MRPNLMIDGEEEAPDGEDEDNEEEELINWRNGPPRLLSGSFSDFKLPSTLTVRWSTKVGGRWLSRKPLWLCWGLSLCH